MSNPLDDELASTLRTIRSLPARSQDELEDYFHDAIVKAIKKARKRGNGIEEWMGYIYRSVSRRISCGQEERPYLTLHDELIPDSRPDNVGLKVDIERAMEEVHPRGRVYLYEYFYEGRTTEEIASRHGITNQAVSKSIQAGLGVMRRVLEG